MRGRINRPANCPGTRRQQGSVEYHATIMRHPEGKEAAFAIRTLVERLLVSTEYVFKDLAYFFQPIYTAINDMPLDVIAVESPPLQGVL